MCKPAIWYARATNLVKCCVDQESFVFRYHGLIVGAYKLFQGLTCSPASCIICEEEIARKVNLVVGVLYLFQYSPVFFFRCCQGLLQLLALSDICGSPT